MKQIPIIQIVIKTTLDIYFTLKKFQNLSEDIKYSYSKTSVCLLIIFLAKSFFQILFFSGSLSWCCISQVLVSLIENRNILEFSDYPNDCGVWYSKAHTGNLSLGSGYTILFIDCFVTSLVQTFLLSTLHYG